MTDDLLKNYVLRRADEDAKLSDDARLVVLAALGDPDDLVEVLGSDATSEELVEALTTPDQITGQPVGAYLQSIAVQGFRGIGPKASLPLRPGPGLIVVAGRNGSGKSTLAEALELALTGTNSRWADKAVVWSQNWRNLHAGEPAEIRIGITEEGSGATTIGVDWPKGTDVKVDQKTTWVQRDGQKREHPSVLGLQVHPDTRVATALEQVTKTKPNLDVVRPLITAGAGSSIPFAWQQAQRLTPAPACWRWA